MNKILLSLFVFLPLCSMDLPPQAQQMRDAQVPELSSFTQRADACIDSSYILGCHCYSNKIQDFLENNPDGTFDTFFEQEFNRNCSSSLFYIATWGSNFIDLRLGASQLAAFATSIKLLERRFNKVRNKIKQD